MSDPRQHSAEAEDHPEQITLREAGLRSPDLLAEPGRNIASFDPSKFAAPQGGNDVAQALMKAVSSDNDDSKPDLGPPINPVTMSGNGFQPNPQPTDGKTFGDTSSEKGFKLGGPKSIPQTLTASAGAFPANNAQNAPGGGGTPGMGGGKGSPGSDAISGDPYAGTGREAPYKSVNYNLVKDGGYASGGGSGGEEGAGGTGEGEVDGGNAEAKEMAANISRPGQFLPAAGDAETGYPGIFAYRGYIRKICNSVTYSC
jgi:hypothetical protein